MFNVTSGYSQARATMMRASLAHSALLTRVHRPNSGEAEDDREALECFALCGHCGYLADEPGGPCPGCGEQRWVDLQSRAAAEMLHRVESQARHEIPPTFQTAGFWAALGVGGGAGAVGYELAASGGGGLGAVAVAVLAALLAGAAAYLLVPRGLLVLAFRRRPLRPMRWHLPHPVPEPGGRSETVAKGTLQLDREPLTAPVSGRLCAGYEVSVLFDAPDDRRPPMWVLEEERLAACSVGGHSLSPDGATLWLPAEPARFQDAGSGEEEALGTFLRKRGLFASDGEYAIFETILEPGGAYRLVRTAQPEDAVLAIVDTGGATATPRAKGLRSHDEVAVSFKRRRRIGQALMLGVVVVLSAGLWLYIKAGMGPTTFNDQVRLLETCDLSSPRLSSHTCEQALVRALRKMVQEPSKCDRVAARLRETGSWERQNRLLNLLLRHRRAIFTESAAMSPKELAPDPRLAGALIYLVKQWQRKHAQTELVPGVTSYNTRLLLRLHNVVVLTAVLQNAPLSRAAKRRLAHQLIRSYRKLFGGATGETKRRLVRLFKQTFYPLWKVYGTPEP